MNTSFLTSRRLFLGSAAAFAAVPGDLFAQSKQPGKGKRARPGSVWERPDGTATDSVMARRLYLDLAGRIPTKDEAQGYVFSEEPRKRAALVDRLLASRDFADYWTMRFCDILRVKSEFPINLWPNAVYVYHARIRAFVDGNEPWDAFGRALLTAQGTNFRDGAVNFFRATDRRTPAGWADAVAQTFLGLAPDAVDPALRDELRRAFANVRLKTTREWKEEIVYVDGPDARPALCDELFGNRRTAVAAAFERRIRAWIFGPDAPAEVPSGELRLKNLLRAIVLSPAYARGSVTGGFPARRLDAEVLDDALCALSGTARNLQSPAPEPFSFLPPKRATVCVEDGSISDGFLTLFGRPARDTGLAEERGSDVTAKQRLYLFNSGKLDDQLLRLVQGGTATPKKAKAKGRPLRPRPGGQGAAPQGVGARIDDLYWRILSRAPAPRERQAIHNLVRTRGVGGKPNRATATLRDIAWCLVNTKEFLYRV